MSKIRFLLKFGKKEYLKDFVNGKLYFSNAIKFWKIEKEAKIKGQGDILEASTKMFAQKMTLHNPDTNEVIRDFGESIGLVKIEPAEKMPVFCLFTVYEDDCSLNSDGKWIITLSDEKKETIRKHFPNADSVAIIDNPKEFIEDIRKSIGTEVKAETVSYFNIDKGLETENGLRAIDLDYMKYLTQDVPAKKENGGTVHSFHADYAYRILFTKDVYFKNEQEYRMVLPSEEIDDGTIYTVNFSNDYMVIDLNQFFKM